MAVSRPLYPLPMFPSVAEQDVDYSRYWWRLSNAIPPLGKEDTKPHPLISTRILIQMRIEWFINERKESTDENSARPFWSNIVSFGEFYP